MRASQFLSPEQRRSVEAAVADAERRTTGEIVIVIATQSGRYDRAEDIFGVCLGALSLLGVWLVSEYANRQNSEWDATALPGLPWVLLLPMAMFVVGAVLATRFPVLARPFVSRKMMLEEMQDRAWSCFHRFRLRHTSGGTGLLIYVSLRERMVWVVGDKGIDAKIEAATWRSICDDLTAAIKRRNAAEGLCSTVRRCGELLAQHFPVATDAVNPNELRNEIYLLD